MPVKDKSIGKARSRPKKTPKQMRQVRIENLRAARKNNPKNQEYRHFDRSADVSHLESPSGFQIGGANEESDFDMDDDSFELPVDPNMLENTNVGGFSELEENFVESPVEHNTSVQAKGVKMEVETMTHELVEEETIEDFEQASPVRILNFLAPEIEIAENPQPQAPRSFVRTHDCLTFELPILSDFRLPRNLTPPLEQPRSLNSEEIQQLIQQNNLTKSQILNLIESNMKPLPNNVKMIFGASALKNRAVWTSRIYKESHIFGKDSEKSFSYNIPNDDPFDLKLAEIVRDGYKSYFKRYVSQNSLVKDSTMNKMIWPISYNGTEAAVKRILHEETTSGRFRNHMEFQQTGLRNMPGYFVICFVQCDENGRPLRILDLNKVLKVVPKYQSRYKPFEPAFIPYIGRDKFQSEILDEYISDIPQSWKPFLSSKYQ